ncbi:type II secretion system F family protein [Candidatus Gracilibacteria bacterium]|nr:type II secretion system F family protein [Candidatus Gracilibacteria bacterium]
MSNLLDSNVTILKTIEIVANSIGNEVYKKRLLLSLEDIKQGIPLAENLADSDLFPPMLVNMIEVGEQTAQLDTMTAKIADFYESEVDTSVEGLSKILEPIILIVVGLSVGLVVAAIMLPIMKLADVAGSV